VNPVSVLVQKRWIEKVGGFDESLKQVEDWDMWLRLAYAGCKMGWVNEVICSYRFSPGQMTRNAAVQKKSIVQMMDKFFSQTDLPLELVNLKSEVYSCAYLFGAGREYGVGQIEDAKESLTKAVEYNPELLRQWGRKILNDIFAWEDSPYCQTAAIDYRENVLDHLPETAAALRSQRRWVMEQAGWKTFYKAYASRDWGLVQRAALVVLKNASPQAIFNRGFVSILVQSLLHANPLRIF
jgi:hypothetical protein